MEEGFSVVWKISPLILQGGDILGRIPAIAQMDGRPVSAAAHHSRAYGIQLRSMQDFE